ncbi:zinc transporter [Maritimibacter sp. 55A14]|uniref:zinc ABC transporter substrate-binding protein n=1 Tax=Maritimibacter sp. 55A14 TaxID=2174844 RepID=UPI000D61268C|nr:zinc ABC transporter substrate-binding protein [Maritimibacter sp. 55A14]PWE31323.1 zinc transporter [Maritimibacter sp. 55A14]
MKAIFLAIAAGALLAGARAGAEPPRVVADIAPVHSLVAQVMAGVGEAELLLPPGASPHGYALRPSQARALSEADLVFWVGPGLTPWLEDALKTLAGDGATVALQEAEGVRLLDYREGATFAAHDHGDDEGHGEHTGHDNHDADDAHEDHDDRAAQDDHDAHDHGDHDPHIWLDPVNAAAIVDAAAAHLVAADPGNAETYRANARAARARLDALNSEIAAQLAPLRGRPFVVFHDAYHYLEARYDIEAAGALSVGDAADPGAARVARIRDAIRDLGARGVFAEPQFDPRLADSLAEAGGARLGVLDPLGAEIAPGPDHYATLMRGIAGAMTACLAEGG